MAELDTLGDWAMVERDILEEDYRHLIRIYMNQKVMRQLLRLLFHSIQQFELWIEMYGIQKNQENKLMLYKIQDESIVCFHRPEQLEPNQDQESKPIEGVDSLQQHYTAFDHLQPWDIFQVGV